MNYYLFGYGSIMSPKSASRGLKRVLHKDDFTHVVLNGYIRTWTAAESLFFEQTQKEATGVFLNLSEKIGKKTNGVLIPISEKELEQMKKREKNYDCVDVTNKIETSLENISVFTFITPLERQAKTGIPNAYIPAGYLDILQDAFNTWGEHFENSYKSTTEDMGFTLMQGPYRFVDAQQQDHV